MTVTECSPHAALPVDAETSEPLRHLEQVVLAAQAGDEQATIEVWQHATEVATKAVWKYATDDLTRETIVANSVSKVMEAGISRKMYATGGFNAWTRRVIANAAIDASRRGRRVTFNTLEDQTTAEWAEGISQVEDTSISRDDNASLERVVTLLDLVSDNAKFKASYVLVRILGLTKQEAANQLGTNPNTVGTNIYRLEKRIREYFDIHDGDKPWDLFESIPDKL